MSKSMLEVISEKDEVVAVESREKIHKEGLFHREVHVLFYTPEGKIIFQKRGMLVDTFPNLLDATAGGHVEIGDSYEQTALKEAQEETGIDISLSDMWFIDFVKNNSFDEVTKNTNNYKRAIYGFCYKGNILDLEIEDVGKSQGFVEIDLKALLENPEKYESSMVKGFLNNKYKEIYRKILSNI